VKDIETSAAMPAPAIASEARIPSISSGLSNPEPKSVDNRLTDCGFPVDNSLHRERILSAPRRI
jgi:hypothetical protein